ncbi:MAG: FG-GAP repeat protein [Planctomycetota bacterium]
MIASILTSFLVLGGGGGEAWAQAEDAKLTATDAAPSDNFGTSVAVSGDIAVIGTEGDDDLGPNSGSAYVCRFDGVAWQEEIKLTASDGAIFDLFGASVAASGDVVVIGADGEDSAGFDAGAAYVFRFNGTTWVEEAKLTASDGASGDRFGCSVSASGDLAIVGARGADALGPDSGAAYIFRFDGTGWFEEAKLIPATGGGTWDLFGNSVSVRGDVAAVGSQGDDSAGFNAGAAYVFVFDGAAWVEEEKLTAVDAAAGDLLGRSVSLGVDFIVVGAEGVDDAGFSGGAAYIFRYDGVSWVWVEEAKLIASDAAAFDVFGRTACVGTDLVVIGAEGADAAGANSGAAYCFRFDGIDWVEEDKLVASDAAPTDLFGGSIGVSDLDVAVVGSPMDDDGGSASGSAYVYNLSPMAPNQDPVAIAICEVLSTDGEGALVRLDATESHDPDGTTCDLTLQWTHDGAPLCEGTMEACGVVDLPLPYGSHTILLTVWDGCGGMGTDPKPLFLEPPPADAGDLSMREAKVDFSHNPLGVKLKGKIPLADGMDPADMAPMALLNLDIGPLELYSTTPILFEVEGNDGNKWEVEGSDAPDGIRKFKIKWKDERFRFKEHGFPVQLKSSDPFDPQPVLEVKYKMEQIGEAFSLTIDGEPLLSVDAEGHATAEVPIIDEEPGKKVKLRLPEPLEESTLFELSDPVQRLISFAEGFQPAHGDYRLEIRYDGLEYPEGSSTEPRTIGLMLYLGAEGIPVEGFLDEEDLMVDGDLWRDNN